MKKVAKHKWIVSSKFDLFVFLGPIFFATLISPFAYIYYPNSIPLWAFVTIIILFDVAHVWATNYRIYFDIFEVKRRPLFYLLPIPVFFIISYLVCFYSQNLFWTILAYVAVFHFIKQPWGFVSIYKRKYQEKSKFDLHFDKYMVWAAGIYPVFIWHSSPGRVFDWFNAGESFIVKLPKEVIPYLYVLYISGIFVYILRQIYLFKTQNFFNLPKNILMSAIYLTWSIGIYITNPLISAAFLNLFHGVPFFAIIWLYSKNKYLSEATNYPFLSKVFKSKYLFLFFGIVFIPALIEEFFWDFMIWHIYLPDLSYYSLSLEVKSFCIALLSLPQIIHYWLDMFIWKMNEKQNPDLKKYLSL
ncbi:MAG: hypothetical protein COB02_06225 [Candidatus Cloacimonadota bacterium]|nr:MAG: hypothetical protein COB02_06225 [Candidatus Cloacimonadota bacterium]